MIQRVANQSQTLSEQIHQRFEATGWSAYKLCVATREDPDIPKTGIHYNTVLRWVNGQGETMTRVLDRIAQALDAELED